jgi:hypothetical protein
MKQEIRLRGQRAYVNHETKELWLYIRKPLGGVYSISDKAYELLTVNKYRVYVIMPEQTDTLEEDTHFRAQRVQSKFPGCQPWYLYWFQVQKKKNEEQRELFKEGSDGRSKRNAERLV